VNIQIGLDWIGSDEKSTHVQLRGEVGTNRHPSTKTQVIVWVTQTQALRWRCETVGKRLDLVVLARRFISK